MRLSDIRGDRCIDVIADITAPVISIAQDEEAKRLFAKRACPEGVEPSDFMLSRVKEALPALLRGHKADLVQILASINGKTPEEYSDGLNLAVLMRDVVELITDEEFGSFFE